MTDVENASMTHIQRVLSGCVALLVTSTVCAEPLSSPSFSGPLQPNETPISFDGGPFGKVYVTGQLSGLGFLQNHAVNAPGTGNSNSLVDVSNAQVEIQTTEGPLQFYLQGGTYALPSLGTPYTKSGKAMDQLYGPLTIAYAKAVISPEFSVMVGALPTLIGAESTFTFQNLNIQRGLLWNQEPAISKGIQVNYAKGPLSVSLSGNDGFYSEKYNWISGSISYAINPSNSISFVGAGNLSRNQNSSARTPLAQNNSKIFNVIYTYTDGALTLNPYLQYSRVGSRPELGIDRSAESFGGALLVKYAVSNRWSLGARAEYIKTSGGGCGGDVGCSPTNLLYGTDSGAWSLTVTPTYQRERYFIRGELGYVHIQHPASGMAFGSDGAQPNQLRALAEVGFLF